MADRYWKMYAPDRRADDFRFLAAGLHALKVAAREQRAADKLRDPAALQLTRFGLFKPV